jgi:hypothetical protein
MAKSLLAKFVYNNSVYSTTDIRFFFAIYGFHFNISLSVKDDRLNREMFTAKKKAEEFKHKGKKLAK